jgi:hypothetical protein
MAQKTHDGDDERTDDQAENRWQFTPLISAADVPRYPTVTIPDERFVPVKAHGRQRSKNGARGSEANHEKGSLGEEAVIIHVEDATELDDDLYTDGDGGIDTYIYGAGVDIKTVGRGREPTALTVNAYKQLRADYYALVDRVGTATFRLIGYAPRQFVANANTVRYGGTSCHYVPQEDLFPFPHWV